MKRKEKSVTQSYVEVIIVALVVALGLRAFLAQSYKIPTKSMEDSLWAGDFVLVNKLTYNFTDPKPGDIIVFKYPLNPSKDFIKRCIATEGQTVQIIDKGLYVDGKKVGNAKHLDDPRWEKFSDPQIYPTEYSNRDNLGPVQVPPGQFFVLGDNRDNSQDSRDWGFLDRKYIKGKAFVIYWSWKQDANAPRFESPYIFPLIKILFHYLVNFPTHIRWERIGKIVR